jgi:tetratricopeptide (TPR) repeat protein
MVRANMNGEVSAEQARKILDMLTDGGVMDGINTSLALRLVPLALELDDVELSERLLQHAKNKATDEIEEGWATFEIMKSTDSSIDDFAELAVKSEAKENGTPLAAAVFHHVALLHLSLQEFQEAQTFANRSIRLREKIEDLSGMSYGLALLETCAKRMDDHDTAIVHGTKRIELALSMKDEEAQIEAMADLAHSQATIGNFDAAKDLYQQSLELSIELEDLSGQLVARWGLADIAEIAEDYETAMLHLSDCLHTFINAGLPTPIAVRQRIEDLADFNNTVSTDESDSQ